MRCRLEPVLHFRNVPTDNSKSFHACPIVEQSTAYLGKLHVHLTTMQPGAGYAPHIDDYDVAIVVLSGQVQTLGQIVEPHAGDLLFCRPAPWPSKCWRGASAVPRL